MLGATTATLFKAMKPESFASLFTTLPAMTQAKATQDASQDASAAPTPPWVPWAIGAALGSGILYLLLRKGSKS